MKDSIDPRERAWIATARWTELRGELLANAIRLAGAGGFYAIHLLDYYVWSTPNEADERFHYRATLIAMIAVALGAAVMLLLRKQVFPAWLKYVSTGVDLLLITFLAAFGSKLGSPIVYAYFALVGVAAIRMRPGLISCATIGGVAGMFALYYASENSTPYMELRPVIRPVDFAAMVLALGLLGAALGQTVRQAKRICREYAARVELIEGVDSSMQESETDREARTLIAAPEGEG
ncbi:MAG TPA: hypothetical protein VGN57_01470 [Pirellulaceae bacterium]|jgi:hypothetical protein|nr:hypothetical protein [Pirellulaceae bacterium]